MDQNCSSHPRGPEQETERAPDGHPFTSLSMAHAEPGHSLLLVASTGFLGLLDREKSCGLSLRGKINLLTVTLQLRMSTLELFLSAS